MVCLFVYTTTHRSLQGLLSDLSKTFQLSPPGVSTLVTTREHPAAVKWNCGRETFCNFVEMTTSTPFWDLLHAVKLQHGTEGFISPPKEGVLRNFSP
jgi:hypothetical protein